MQSDTGGFPVMGMLFNLIVAVVLGTVVSLTSDSLGGTLSDGMVFAMCAALLAQEIVIVQIFYREANIDFQERLLQGQVTRKNRNLVLFVPFATIMLIGLVVLGISERPYGAMSILRVICVSLIITLGLDPLLGLFDRGPFAVFGAAVVYFMVLEAGYNGHGLLALRLEGLLGMTSSVALASCVFCYLMLSARWTYYRLFCFGRYISDWKHSILDTGIPLIIIAAPGIPLFITMLLDAFAGA